DPGWVRSVCERHPGRVVLGIDARDGFAATHGWLETSERTALEVARQAAAWPIAAVIYTDIRKDGMLEGPNFDALTEMARAIDVPVIASGGVGNVEQVRKLAGPGLAGCVIGRALYEGHIILREALAAAAGAAT